MAVTTLKIVLEAYDRLSSPINAAVTKAQSKLAAFEKTTDRLANKNYHAGKELMVAGFAVAAPLYKAFEAASDFETKMIDIRKQLGDDDKPPVVKAMTEEIFKLSKEIPLATGEIQDMIASGLRMDIPREKIIAYTKDVAKMATAFEMDPGQIADDMGKIAGLYDIPLENINNLADSINYLDDKTKTKGPELIETIQRIGGSVAKYLKPEQAAALASTMLTLGETPERASSGIQKLMAVLGAAGSMSKRTRGAFSKLGLDPEELEKSMTTDAQGTIMKVFDTIHAKVPQAKVKGVLIDLFGVNHLGKMEKLANGMQEYQRQIGLAQGTKKVGSMQDEYNKRMQGSAAQMQLFKNRLHELWVKIGTNLLPTVNKIILKVGAWVEKVGQFIEKHPRMTKGILMAAGAFAGLSLAFGYVRFALSGFFRLLSMGSGAIKLLLNPIGSLTRGKRGLFRVIINLKNAFQQWKSIASGAIGGVVKAGSFIGRIVTPILSNLAGVLRGQLINAIKGVGMGMRILNQVFMSNPIVRILSIILIIGGIVFGMLIKKFGSVKGAWDALCNVFKRLTHKYFLDPINTIKEKIEMVKKKFQDLVQWFKGTWIGKKIMGMLGKGIEDNKAVPVKKIAAVTQDIRDHFPASPVKKGPLKTLYKTDIVGLIAKTIKLSPLGIMAKVAQRVVNLFQKGFSNGNTTIPVKAGISDTAGMVANVTINLNGGATKKDGDMLKQELDKYFASLMKKYEDQRRRVSLA